MSEPASATTILIPIDASDPGEPPASLVELLSPLSVVILGYYPVPDQTGTDQLREQVGEDAQSVLSGVSEQFQAAGADVETVLVFTKDRLQTIDRIAAEHEADAVLSAGTVGEELEQILVPLRGDENVKNILEFVTALLESSDATVTFFNVAKPDDAPRGELIVRGARDRLVESGVESERIDWEQREADSTSAEILDAAAAHDLLIVGESEPSLRKRILGTVPDKVIKASRRPVLVVRKRDE